jgi:exodeoxyribonuclease VII small subunit
MSDDRSTFEVTRARLEDIVVQVRRKDVSLEQSLDMLEEAVRLVNQCNELIDQTSFKPVTPEGEAVTGEAGVDDVSKGLGTVEVVEFIDVNGDGTVDVVQVVELLDGTENDAPEAETSEEGADAWGSIDAWDESPAVPAADEEDDARE